MCRCVRDSSGREKCLPDTANATDCGAKNEIKAREPIRCRECGHRIMYKKRTKRSTSRRPSYSFHRHAEPSSSSGAIRGAVAQKTDITSPFTHICCIYHVFTSPTCIVSSTRARAGLHHSPYCCTDTISPVKNTSTSALFNNILSGGLRSTPVCLAP